MTASKQVAYFSWAPKACNVAQLITFAKSNFKIY